MFEEEEEEEEIVAQVTPSDGQYETKAYVDTMNAKNITVLNRSIEIHMPILKIYLF